MTEGARRSPHAQMAAMQRLWPEFVGRKNPDGLLVWTGPLRPKAQLYRIGVLWKPVVMSLPYVVVLDPKIQPRSNSGYESIPHLIFDSADPENSGLCLFDPEGREWTGSDLIAETTIKWAAEWLTYYELWHVTGEWLAPGVGYESVAHMQSAEARAFRQAVKDVH